MSSSPRTEHAETRGHWCKAAQSWLVPAHRDSLRTSVTTSHGPNSPASCGNQETSPVQKHHLSWLFVFLQPQGLGSGGTKTVLMRQGVRPVSPAVLGSRGGRLMWTARSSITEDALCRLSENLGSCGPEKGQHRPVGETCTQ